MALIAFLFPSVRLWAIYTLSALLTGRGALFFIARRVAERRERGLRGCVWSVPPANPDFRITV